MILAAWLHTLSPFVARFTDDFGIRWYGVAYLAGFAMGYYVLLRLARAKLVAIPQDRVADAIVWMIGGVLVGGRLGYVAVYDPSLFVDFTKHLPFWGVLAINKGGMASHGGIVGVIVAAWRVSRGWRDPATGQVVGRCPPLHVTDITALICVFGLGFGRLANFVNGELLGRIVTPPGTSGPWWSVQYPQELAGWAPFFAGKKSGPIDPAPALTAEQTRDLIDLVALINTKDPVAGLQQVIHHPARYADQLRHLLSSRHPSQLYQAAAEGLILGLVLWAVWAKPRRPGIVGAWFLGGYGVLRILTEFIRLPDPQFAEGRPMGLSRGQWLSVGMVVGAMVVVALVRKWGGEPMGGWLTRKRAIKAS